MLFLTLAWLYRGYCGSNQLFLLCKRAEATRVMRQSSIDNGIGTVDRVDDLSHFTPLAQSECPSLTNTRIGLDVGRIAVRKVEPANVNAIESGRDRQVVCTADGMLIAYGIAITQRYHVCLPIMDALTKLCPSV